MSYETMEALVVEKIADLRESEAMFARSLQDVQKGAHTIDFHAAQERIRIQLREVEQLLAAMDTPTGYGADAIPQMLVVDAQQMNASVWM